MYTLTIDLLSVVTKSIEYLDNNKIFLKTA